MLRLIGLIVSIGLADSINPSTIGPALFIASGERPLGRVAEFTLGVFVVSFVGGAIILLGPGQLLLALVPRPRPAVEYILEIVAGAAMVVAGAMLLRFKDQLIRRETPDFDPHGRSSMILGATISAVELPTAFPYFAAIAAIVGSGFGPGHQVLYLVLFNACFLAPLFAIMLTLAFAGDQAQEVLATGRAFLQRHWPALLAGLAFLAGSLVLALGATGLAGLPHGRFARFFRHLHHGLSQHITH